LSYRKRNTISFVKRPLVSKLITVKKIFKTEEDVVVFWQRCSNNTKGIPIKRIVRGGEFMEFHNYFLFMSWIEIKAMKSLLKEL
jgi:hypothetical protein